MHNDLDLTSLHLEFNNNPAQFLQFDKLGLRQAKLFKPEY